MNRGQAKRPVFHSRKEIRYFQFRLAREVKRGELEVHGYCFLTTHFHLLLRSLHGHLSEAMRRIENPFVRWFNRRHNRDGALFRGRFTSRRIHTDQYVRNVRRYIDNNPVAAGLVSHPAEYPHGGAWVRRGGTPPLWLHPLGTEHVEAATRPITEHAMWVVERRLERRAQDDDFDDLIGAAPEEVQRWMERTTRVADGPQPPHCLISPPALRRAIEIVRTRIGPWTVFPRTRGKDGWGLLTLGMSREFVGLSTLEVSMQLGAPRSSAGHALLEHRRLMLSDTCYAERAAEVLRLGLSITFGSSKAAGAIRDDSSGTEWVRDRS